MATIKPDDPLMTDPAIRVELGISNETLKRWRKQGVLPEPTVIRGRYYTRHSHVEKLKNEGDGSKPRNYRETTTLLAAGSRPTPSLDEATCCRIADCPGAARPGTTTCATHRNGKDGRSFEMRDIPAPEDAA